jgi:hypothetical protein
LTKLKTKRVCGRLKAAGVAHPFHNSPFLTEQGFVASSEGCHRRAFATTGDCRNCRQGNARRGQLEIAVSFQCVAGNRPGTPNVRRDVRHEKQTAKSVGTSRCSRLCRTAFRRAEHGRLLSFRNISRGLVLSEHAWSSKSIRRFSSSRDGRRGSRPPMATFATVELPGFSGDRFEAVYESLRIARD